MIIALSGPSHSGKTTYLKWLEENIPNVIVHNEIIRDYGESIEKIRKDAYRYFEIQKEIIWKKYDQEQIANSKDAIFGKKYIYVFDRSMCDSIYYLTHYVDVLALNNGDRSKYYQFCFKAFDWARKSCRYIYNRIFLFDPINAENNSDPMRPQDIAQKQHIEYTNISALVNIICASEGASNIIRYINAITDTNKENFYRNTEHI